MTQFRILQRQEFQEPYLAGQVVFHKGDPGDKMYVVVEGEVDIVSDDKVIATLGSGEVFGEMALIDGNPRSASAVARTDCQIVPVDEDRFLFLVQNTPYFALELMRVLVERIRSGMT